MAKRSIALGARRFIAATAAILGLTGGLVSTAQAAPAPQSVRVKVASTTSVSRPDQIGAHCQPGHLSLSRFSSCQVTKAIVTLLRNGTPVGEAAFTITISQHLNRKSLDWREDISLSKAVMTPTAEGTRVEVFASSPGNATRLTYPQARLLGPAERGTLEGQFNLRGQQARAENTNYQFVFSKTGFTPGGFGINTARYRCDDTFKNMAPGCVFPTVATEVSMAGFPNISRGIRDLRHRGGHWGDPNGGPPLTWLGSWIRPKHWKEVCKGKKPTAAERRKGLTSCDEYPFASTLQGGSTLAASQREITFVHPTEENSAQGGTIQGFLKSYRVLSGDKIYVEA